MIYISKHNNIKKILIEDNIDDILDIEKFLKEIEDKNLNYEITFIGINSIPSKIVKALYRLQDRVKIQTTQRTLWLYLKKLNINNSFKHKENEDKFVNTPIKAITISGSIGSLKKISYIIKSLPYADITIFIVVHTPKDEKSDMVEILQKLTDYKVYEAKQHMKVEKNAIYIAPPNNHMIVTDGFLYLNQKELVEFARPSISITFKSLAYEYKSSLLAILLCGYGKDGSSALEDLIKVNSQVILEDLSDCQAQEMIINAINTNNYNKILKLDDINKFIQNKLFVNVDVDDEFDKFLDNIFLYYGYDFRNYNKKSLLRRLDIAISQSKYNSFYEFSQAIFNDEELFSKLLRVFSINVTTFFRNPNVFKEIKKEIINSKVKSLRIWCAGCSRGDEPYSIAIMLDEIGILDKSLIYATDFNENIIQEAKNGLYSISEFEKFQNNYIKSGNNRAFEDYFEINKDFIEVKKYIKDKVVFFQHNLATDSSINLFDIILCRNVLIYFDDKLKERVFNLIDESLVEDGYLILGESENLLKRYSYKKVGDIKNKIFKKVKM